MARWQDRREAARMRARFFPKPTTRQEEDVLRAQATEMQDLQRQTEADMEKVKPVQKKVPENSGKPKKMPVEKVKKLKSTEKEGD